MSEEAGNILAFMAHPDDAEFLCAGTLARLRERGCRIHIATMTAGDGGSAALPPEEIARIRRQEATRSAALIDSSYRCAEARDFFIVYEPSTLRRAIEIIRETAPSLVITHSPVDYMVDHEMTSLVVRAACFAAPAPNARSEAEAPSPPLGGVPWLYYADPLEGKDALGRGVEPDFYVDITGTIELKERMLACHASQREWLRQQHGMDHYLEVMRQWSARRGAEAGVGYAEAFRQHAGHAYPQENRLATLLGAVKRRI
jgi:LmbE family N-acetylglucosaminyl deacetylase